MGRSASHITLECALQTRPNWAWIGEEVQQQQLSLRDIANRTADIVVARSQASSSTSTSSFSSSSSTPSSSSLPPPPRQKKDYGVFLIPEGLIEFVPEVGKLIAEINK